MKTFSAARMLKQSALIASCLYASSALGQTVTVSLPGGGGDETSIQAAIDSLAPGGSRDDGNKLNNRIEIIDDGIYREALKIENLGLTIIGTGASRPTIIATLAQTAGSTGNPIIRIDADEPVVLENLIILPDAVSPSPTAILADEMTSLSGYTLTLENVLIAGNNGSDAPTSVDGRTAPTAGTVTFTGEPIILNSPPTIYPAHITLNRTVLTGASPASTSLLRIYSDNGTVTFGPGFTASFSGGHGVYASTSENNTFSWLGSESEPILLHGNAFAAFYNASPSTRGVATMRYVAVTGNSHGGNWSTVYDTYNGATPSDWENVTIAGNSSREGNPPGDSPFRLAASLVARNSIFAGDGMESVRVGSNLLRIDGGGNSLQADGVCIDISQGATTLNLLRLEDQGVPLNGMTSGNLIAVGEGIKNGSPGFWSLDPASADYLAVSNSAFIGAAPGGEDLVGAGSYKEIPFVGMLTQSGNLQSYLETFPIPGAASSDKYRQPTADELMLFREAMDDLLSYRFQSASNRFALINYDLVIYQDTAQGGRRYAVVRENGVNNGWRGIYAFDLEPRRELVMQSPHPLFDGTRVQAIDLFFRTESFLFLQSGTHRNNSDEMSPCDGTQSSGDPYRLSDMAHNEKSFFQIVHEQAFRRFRNTVSVSVHGMAAASDPSDVVISNGTAGDVIGQSLSKDVANTMNFILNAASDSRYAVSHQEPGEFPALSGSTNTQGRFCNGSHDACRVAVPAWFPERFIHMEQAPSVRVVGNPSSWDFVVQTYNGLIGDFAPWSVAPFGDGSPVLRYDLDGTIEQIIGYGDGLAVGNVVAAENRFGNAAEAIELTNSGYAVLPGAEYSQDDREFTLQFWFRATPATNSFQYLYSHGDLGRTGQVIIPNTIHIYLDSATGNPRMRFTTAQGTHFGFDGTNAVNDGNWHLFTLTLSTANGATVYIDGQAVANQADLGGNAFAPEGPVYLGARSDLGASRFLAEGVGVSGGLDQLVILNAVLTPAQVLEAFNEAPTSLADWLQLAE